MKTTVHRPLLLLALFTGACASAGVAGQRFRAEALPRVAFDLKCPEEQVRLQVLRDTSEGQVAGTENPEGSIVGVEGCGQRATYVFINRGWVMNGPLRTPAK